MLKYFFNISRYLKYFFKIIKYFLCTCQYPEVSFWCQYLLKKTKKAKASQFSHWNDLWGFISSTCVHVVVLIFNKNEDQAIRSRSWAIKYQLRDWYRRLQLNRWLDVFQITSRCNLYTHNTHNTQKKQRPSSEYSNRVLWTKQNKTIETGTILWNPNVCNKLTINNILGVTD